MNLDPRRSGKARDVRIDPTFGEWLLRTIRDRLQPRFVICLGLRAKRVAVNLLEQTFGFDGGRPHDEYSLACYE